MGELKTNSQYTPLLSTSLSIWPVVSVYIFFSQHQLFGIALPVMLSNALLLLCLANAYLCAKSQHHRMEIISMTRSSILLCTSVIYSTVMHLSLIVTRSRLWAHLQSRLIYFRISCFAWGHNSVHESVYELTPRSPLLLEVQKNVQLLRKSAIRHKN